MKIWITAGGTGSAWHICQIAKKYYSDRIELFVSDINEPQYVAASTLADHFFVVPPVRAKGYAEEMYRLLKENNIDVIIPLIPWEQVYFAPDCVTFAQLGIQSLAPELITSRQMNNKIQLHDFCVNHQIPTIALIKPDEVQPGQMYFVKEIDGFGAVGAKKIVGRELLEQLDQIELIQEFCGTSEGCNEITMEVFYDKTTTWSIARRRLESKCGVCTKATFVKVPEAEAIVAKMVDELPFPTVFNIQFINHDGIWKVMDVNLRLAAGTGLSNAAGFQLIRAALAYLLQENVDKAWLTPDDTIKTVLRVYEEVVIR